MVEFQSILMLFRKPSMLTLHYDYDGRRERGIFKSGQHCTNKILHPEVIPFSTSEEWKGFKRKTLDIICYNFEWENSPSKATNIIYLVDHLFYFLYFTKTTGILFKVYN